MEVTWKRFNVTLMMVMMMITTMIMIDGHHDDHDDHDDHDGHAMFWIGLQWFLYLFGLFCGTIFEIPEKLDIH